MRAPDAPVALRPSPRHAHAMMRELNKCAEGGLADRDEVARKSVKAPSLLDPGVRRALAPPF
eukprot:3473780-Prymnesium_polylepis.1